MVTTILCLTGIVLINLVVQCIAYKQPLHPDSGLFLYRAVLGGYGETFTPGRRNGKGYSDFSGDYSKYQIKFIIYVFMDCLYTLFSPNPKIFRFFFAIYNSFSVIAVFWLGQMIFGELQGMIGALIYTLLCANPFSDSQQIHAEHYAVFPLVLTIISLIYGVTLHSFIILVLSGIIMSATVFLFKITFILEVAVLLIAGFLAEDTSAFLGLLVGFGGFFFLLYAWCYVNDALPSLLSQINIFRLIKILFHYRNNFKSDFEKNGGLKHFDFIKAWNFSSGSLPFFVFCGITALFSSSEQPLSFVLILAVMAASIMGIFIQGKFFQSHLLPIYPLAAVITGEGVVWLMNSSIWFIKILPLLLFAYWCAVIFLVYYKNGPLGYHLQKCQIGGYPALSYLASETMADYIKRHSSRGERILQWGYHHELYVLAQRRGTLGPRLESSLQTDTVLSDGLFGHVWRGWLIDAVTTQSPLYIADLEGSLNIDFLNKATGLTYRCEKLFYNMYPMYRLIDASPNEPVPIELNELTAPSGTTERDGRQISNREHIEEINKIFNQSGTSITDVFTKGGVSELLEDWCALNKTTMKQNKVTSQI